MESETKKEYSVQKTLQRIKALRTSLKISAELMADELDISPSAYSKLENNQTNLTLEKLFSIAQILNKPLEEILEIKPERIYKQNLYDSSVGHQEIETLYQDSKELVQQLIKQNEQEKEHLKAQIVFLQGLVSGKKGI